MFNLLSKGLYGIAGLLGLMVMLGWFLDIRALIQVHPSYVPMQFNTALCFALIALGFITSRKLPPYLLKIIIAVPLFIAGITLLQYLLNANFGLDELFFAHHLDIKTSHPGRMAPNTAICFVLMSLNYLCLSSNRPSQTQHIIAGSLAILTLALAVVAAIGYLLEIEQTYGWAQFTRMAMHTSIGFIILSCGFFIQYLLHCERQIPNVILSVQVGFLSLVVTLVLWQALNIREKDYENQQVVTELDYFIQNINTEISNYYDASIRFSKVIEIVPQQFQATLKTQLNESLQQYSALIGVARANSDGAIVWHYPESIDRSVILQSFDPNLIALPQSNELVLGHIQQAPDMGALAAAHKPNFGAANTTGVKYLALLDVTQLISTMVDKFLHQDLNISINDTNSKLELFKKGSFEDNAPTHFVLLNLGHQRWQISVQQSTSAPLAPVSTLSVLVLLFGLLLSILFVALTHTLLVHRGTNKKLIQQYRENNEALKQVSETQKRLKLSSEVSGLGTWVWYINEGKIEWDEQMYHIYELDNVTQKEQLLYDHWFQSLHPDDKEATVESLQNAVASKTPWHEEFRIIINGKQEKFILASATYELDDNGEVTTVIGSNKDITEQKSTEKRLNELRIKSEQNSIAKSQFLANMSHEIRTPMNGVLGIADLLQQTELNKVQDEYVGLITRSAKSLLGILNDILDHSKIEAGMLDLHYETISLDSFFGDLLKGFAISAHQKGVDLYHHIDTNTPDCVITDPVRLRQIIYNLVGNALKFTDTGHVNIEVFHPINQPVSAGTVFNLIVKISDTGCGIAPDKLQHVFESFTQEDGSTTRKYGGTGLGLPISQKLAQLMDGNIEVESQPAKGSTFKLQVQVKAGNIADLPITEDTQHLLSNANFKELNCLAVDDNAINRRWLQDMVISWGGKIQLANSADEALNILKNKEFDVMLVDHNMPEKDGLDLIHELKHLQVKKPEIVIMLSSSDFDVNVSKVKELGIDHYLMKPVKQSEVFNTIQEAIFKNNGISDNPPVEAPVKMPKAERELFVLIAEDNPVNSRLVQDILKFRGHNFDIAVDGLEALEKVKQKEFDLILMDVQMPNMDGLEATRLIRQYEHSENKAPVFIIGLTAHALTGDRDVCIEAGMNDYLTKPIISDELIAAIETEKSGSRAVQEKSKEHLKPTQKSKYTWFDRDQGMKITGNNSDTLKAMADLTIRILPEELDKIDFAHMELQDIAKTMHKIRGMVSNFSVPELPNSIFKLEKSLEDNPKEKNAAEWTRLALHLEALLEDLQTFLQSDQS
ncbi:MAG: response regulator [Aestuariibacter sp.]